MTVARPPQPHPNPALMGWGDRRHVPELPEAVIALLRDGLGIAAPAPAPPAPEEIELPAVRLGEATVAELESIVGAAHVQRDRGVRLGHTRGRSTPDLLRLRAGEAAGAPDLVVFPAGHDEILAVLELCSRERIALTPYGGGTSVVGGLEPDTAGHAGLVALDVRRLDGLLALDEISRLAVLEPGLRGPQA